MRIKVIGLVGVFLLLAACSSTPPAPPPGPPGAGGPGGAGGVGAAVPGSQQDLAQNAGDRVFFEFDRSDISSEAQQILERQASWLQHYPNVSVTIEGHCDERGTREYNLALGERRADAVKNVLVAAGIPASRISTISYGKERPIVVGLERGGLGAEPRRHHHRELNVATRPGRSGRSARFRPDPDGVASRWPGRRFRPGAGFRRCRRFAGRSPLGRARRRILTKSGAVARLR